MKTMFKALAATAVLGVTLSGCAVYVPPVGVGVGVDVGPGYRYSEQPRYYGGGRGYYGGYGRGYYRPRY